MDYLQIKKQVDRRDIWIGQLIAAQATASGTTRKSRWKKIRMTKAIWKKARDVKCALGQLNRCRGLLQVTHSTHKGLQYEQKDVYDQRTN